MNGDPAVTPLQPRCKTVLHGFMDFEPVGGTHENGLLGNTPGGVSFSCGNGRSHQLRGVVSSGRVVPDPLGTMRDM
jgi:hypothetical protein